MKAYERHEAYLRTKAREGATVKEMAVFLGVSKSSINRWCASLGLVVRDSRIEKKQQIYDAYKPGMTVADLALASDCHIETARKWARAYGFDLRSVKDPKKTGLSQDSLFMA